LGRGVGVASAFHPILAGITNEFFAVLKICEDIIAALHDAGKDEVSLVVISGSGSTFSYGWDLDQFESISHFDRRELLQKFR
jgi:enoyl-CoA hydratase/carnithine racemase